MSFVVFSLPRSRSAWLSVLLSSPNAPVGHDIGTLCKRPSDFTDRLGSLAGTCETGAAFAWRLIRRELPETRFAVVIRNPYEVNQSLEKMGFSGQQDEMLRRFGFLEEIAAQEGVFSVDFADLARSGVCAALHRHCLGTEMSLPWWEQLNGLNVQVQMSSWINVLRDNADDLRKLKDQIANA